MCFVLLQAYLEGTLQDIYQWNIMNESADTDEYFTNSTDHGSATASLCPDVARRNALLETQIDPTGAAAL